MAEIDKLYWRYRKQSTFLIAGLSLIAFTVMKVCFLNAILTPLVICAVFSLLVEYSIIMIWKRIAKRSPESLPTFFMAVSGFRMLLGIALLFVCYFIADRNTMLIFFIVFAAFYFTLLIHHAIFFTRKR